MFNELMTQDTSLAQSSISYLPMRQRSIPTQPALHDFGSTSSGSGLLSMRSL
jgi:hypothetical protein